MNTVSLAGLPWFYNMRRGSYIYNFTNSNVSSVNQYIKIQYTAFIYYAFNQEKLDSHRFGWINKTN